MNRLYDYYEDGPDSVDEGLEEVLRDEEREMSDAIQYEDELSCGEDFMILPRPGEVLTDAQLAELDARWESMWSKIQAQSERLKALYGKTGGV